MASATGKRTALRELKGPRTIHLCDAIPFHHLESRNGGESLLSCQEDVDSDYLFDNCLQLPVFLNVPLARVAGARCRDPTLICTTCLCACP